MPQLQSKLAPTIVAVLSYVVMAGFFTQSGIVLEPVAHHFGRAVTDTAGVFSYLVGGNLAGIIASLVIFNLLSIRATFVAAYVVMFAGVALACTTRSFALASLAIALIGFGGGLGLSAGAVIISKTYAANRRAIAFLATDCAFSLAGFVFPAIAAVSIARGLGWASGYVVVAAVAAIVLVGNSWVRFPSVRRTLGRRSQARSTASNGALARVGLFGTALALYLCGQSVFLIWSPSYLQTVFGLSALDAGKSVSSFWGPSIFGLVVAALVTARIAPRVVLLVAASAAVAFLSLIAATGSVTTFFALTAAFGFSSTCMYKLMISVGSEQIEAAPPQLVTFLLLAGSVGGTLAPIVSAQVVRALGPHAGPSMTLACYAGALAVVVLVLALERSARRAAFTHAVAS